MSDLGYAAIFMAIIAVASAASETAARLKWIGKSTGRKILHITAGVLVSFLPWFVKNQIYLLVIGALVLATLYYLVAWNKLEGINDPSKRNWGMVYFPVSFLLLVLFFIPDKREIFAISFLLMTFSDPFAAITGTRIKSRKYNLTRDEKSTAGSVAFLISTLFLTSLFLYYEAHWLGREFTPLFIFSFLLIIPVTATLLEAIPSGGLDNITVPLGSAFLINIALTTPEIQILTGFFAAVAIGFIAFKYRMLTLDGAIGTVVLGTFIFVYGGLQWSLPVLMFFFSSSLLSKIRIQHNRKVEERFEKSGTRGIFQVLANGGIGGAVLLLESYFNTGWLYLVYVLSFAAAAADTWGTEVGTMWRTRTISLRNFNEVPQGVSGGVSLPGTLGALLGAAMVVITTYYWTADLVIFVSLVGLGFVGSMIDSLMGEFLQVRYRCVKCGLITERKNHCEQKTAMDKGYSFITNDIVNFCSTATSLLLFILIYNTRL
ncbi:MAG: DUF92 domain-containing protein [Ignavibacteriales bacterium]|nr:MAG: DUF92 domain-containing protein [Ignavibacteriaceae bacterium]MBW7872044.1 DUF92 domain-containing protein [Ignavibacteria bacterium]MCZ2143679.1 DUF92 domain-containing protein [Ignavibacteriales bacterium]MBV6446059.1 hypothetical protein [Ignavibacteriaceae bacterium]MBZ0195714.1 DUF92 domain-containing protein [Ignavibacteriaceae bacterium]